MTHDRDNGVVKKALINNNNNCIISVAEDGTFYTYKFDF